MFLKNKKAFPNFMLTIIVLGVISTFLLIFITDTAFQKDPPACFNLEFSVAFCSDENRYELSFSNSKENSLNLEINGQRDISNYLIPARQSKIISIPSGSTGPRLEIIPLVVNENGVLTQCQSQKINRQTNTIGRC